MNREGLLVPIIAIVMTASLLFAGCAPEAAPPPEEEETPPPEEEEAPPAAPEAQVFNWRWQTYMMPTAEAYPILEESLERLSAATKGQLNITLYPGNALVPDTEIMDAVGSGVIEGAVGCGGYLAGKDIGLSLMFQPMAGVLNSDWELAAWFYDYDGIELINEAYEEWGLYFLPPNISIYPLEPMMSTVSLAKLDDFEGVMIRSFPGPSGDMLTALGATVTPIAGAEIYTALETGVVDAAEYTGFMENWDAGLHEVSKYALYPSPHVLASIRDITITLDSWNALSPDLQAALEMACNDFTVRDYFTEKGTQEIGRKMMEDYGIIIQSLSDEDWATCMQIGKQLAEEYKQKTATANKVITSQIEAAKALGTW